MLKQKVYDQMYISFNGISECAMTLKIMEQLTFLEQRLTETQQESILGRQCFFNV